MTQQTAIEEPMFSTVAESILLVSKDGLKRFCGLRGEELRSTKNKVSELFAENGESVTEKQLLDIIPEPPARESQPGTEPLISFSAQWLLDNPDFDFNDPFKRGERSQQITSGILKRRIFVRRSFTPRKKSSRFAIEKTCPICKR